MSVLHSVPMDVCPACHSPLTVVTNIEGIHAPEPGDITICLYCETVLVFDRTMLLLQLTRALYNELDEDTQLAVALMRQQVAEIRRKAKADKGMH